MSQSKARLKTKFVKTLGGHLLMCGRSAQAKLSRYKFYARDAIFFSIGFNFLKIGLFNDDAFILQLNNQLLNIASQMLITFISIFLMNFIWYEIKIGKASKNEM